MDVVSSSNAERRHRWFVRTALTWLAVSAFGAVFTFRYPWQVVLFEIVWSLLSLTVWIVGDSWMAPKTARPQKTVSANVSTILPRGFVPRGSEDVLFSYPTRCGLPRTQTQTFGSFVGPVMAAESDSRVVTGPAKSGSLTITSERIVVHVGSEVKEWPISTITSVYAASPRTLVVRIANVGAANFSWQPRIANQAEDAIKRALRRIS